MFQIILTKFSGYKIEYGVPYYVKDISDTVMSMF